MRPSSYDCSSPGDVEIHLGWGIDDALETVRRVEGLVRPLGLFTSLTGGVLYKGHSEKDLDLVFAQLSGQSGAFPRAALTRVLEGLGWKMYAPSGRVEAWRLASGYPADCWMHTVECWVTPSSQRVDVFRWEERPPSFLTRAWRWLTGPMRAWT